MIQRIASPTRRHRFRAVFAALGSMLALPGCPVDSNADVGETTMTGTISTTMMTTAGTEADSSSSAGAETEIGPVDFATDLQPIWTEKCTKDTTGMGCHEPGGTWGPMISDLDMTEGVAYASLLEAQPSEAPLLKYVEPNDAAKSYILYKLRGTQTMAPGGGSGVQMPQPAVGVDFMALSDHEINLIEAWIEQGAPE